MRIVAGELRGAKLETPSGTNTRPTSDRVRESIFNILDHGCNDFSIADARILDLFAGTGALGLEALSRGAKICNFIDDNANARGIIRNNIEKLKVNGRTKVWRRDASKLGQASKSDKYDLIFADPPYEKGLGQKALDSALAGGWLNEGALFILEERENVEIKTPETMTLLDERTYGDTKIWFFQKN